MGVGFCNGMRLLAMYAALNLGAVSVVSPLAATYPLFTLALSAPARRRLTRCARRQHDLP